MFQTKRRRGRPKGSGIDDSDRIARLSELIRNNPDLKPTTAIRAMGITDPSIVRRIRDKYKKTLQRTTLQGPALVAAPAPAARTSEAAAAASITRH